MDKNDIRYQTYVNILKEELVPAFGCTEPIALAYAAAKARQTLGALPDRGSPAGKRQHYQKCKERDRPQHRPSQGYAGRRGRRHHRRGSGQGTGSDLPGSRREDKRDPGISGKCPDRCGTH